MAHGNRTLQQWNQWLSQDFLGGKLLQAEQKNFHRLASQHFGKHAVLIGVPSQVRLLSNTALSRHTLITPLLTRDKIDNLIETDLQELPIVTGSVDLVALPHTLEFLDNPRQLLAEACRIIKPGGLIIISGFNPYSAWGVKKMFGKQKSGQWSGNFISSFKLKDWLELADFQMENQAAALFRPPVSDPALYEKLSMLEKVGAKCFPLLAGVYLVSARAKVIPLTPIRWKWKQKLSSVNIRTSISGHIARQAK